MPLCRRRVACLFISKFPLWVVPAAWLTVLLACCAVRQALGDALLGVRGAGGARRGLAYFQGQEAAHRWRQMDSASLARRGADGDKAAATYLRVSCPASPALRQDAAS